MQFLVDTGNERIKKEKQISLQAGELVGKLNTETECVAELMKMYQELTT